jgi:hypothetical protein
VRLILSLAICLMSAVAAVPTAALDNSQPSFGWGRVLAVGSEDMNLLLQKRDGFALVILNDNAAIRDARGAPMALTEVVRGCDVEYVGKVWGGMTIVSSLRVSCNSLVTELQPKYTQVRRSL